MSLSKIALQMPSKKVYNSSLVNITSNNSYYAGIAFFYSNNNNLENANVHYNRRASFYFQPYGVYLYGSSNNFPNYIDACFNNQTDFYFYNAYDNYGDNNAGTVGSQV